MACTQWLGRRAEKFRPEHYKVQAISVCTVRVCILLQVQAKPSHNLPLEVPVITAIQFKSKQFICVSFILLLTERSVVQDRPLADKEYFVIDVN